MIRACVETRTVSYFLKQLFPDKLKVKPEHLQLFVDEVMKAEIKDNKFEKILKMIKLVDVLLKDNQRMPA